jgi:LL-H family phage holin
MEVFVDGLAGAIIQGLTVIILSLATYGVSKLNAWLDKRKKNDELGIVDKVTDLAVDYVEAEFTGLKGVEKRDEAVNFALKVLAKKGVKIDHDEVIAGIENGVKKFNQSK